MADKKTTTSKKTAAQKAKASPKKPAKKSDGPVTPASVCDGQGLTMKQLHDLYHVLVTDLNFDRSRGQFKQSHAYRFHLAVRAVTDAMSDADKQSACAALNKLICQILSVDAGTLALSSAQFGAFEKLLITDTGFAHIGPYNKCDVDKGEGCDPVWPGRSTKPTMQGW